MNAITRWLVRPLLGVGSSPREPAVRTRLGELEGWVSIVVNLALAAGKVFLGVSLHSAGLISDAVHSLGDMATSLVVIVGFRISKKPPDPEHPFGHERSEHIATLIIAVLLVIAGIEIAKETVLALLGNPRYGEAIPVTWAIFGVLASFVVAKELLARFSAALGRIIESPALAADAWHHRTDALSTAVVAAGLAGRNLGYPWLDGVAGIAVSLFVVFSGLEMAYRSFSPLLGETVGGEELERIRAVARSLPGVVDAHDIRVQRYGGFNITTVHIEVSDRLDVHRMHELTVTLEMRVLKALPGECVVHIDPIDFHHPLFDEVSTVLKNAVVAHRDLVDFHDLNLWRRDGEELGDVEISVEPKAYGGDHKNLADYVSREVGRHFPDLRLTVRVKLDFSATRLEG